MPEWVQSILNSLLRTVASAKLEGASPRTKDEHQLTGFPTDSRPAISVLKITFTPPARLVILRENVVDAEDVGEVVDGECLHVRLSAQKFRL